MSPIVTTFVFVFDASSAPQPIPDGDVLISPPGPADPGPVCPDRLLQDGQPPAGGSLEQRLGQPAGGHRRRAR